MRLKGCLLGVTREAVGAERGCKELKLGEIAVLSLSKLFSCNTSEVIWFIYHEKLILEIVRRSTLLTSFKHGGFELFAIGMAFSSIPPEADEFEAHLGDC